MNVRFLEMKLTLNVNLIYFRLMLVSTEWTNGKHWAFCSFSSPDLRIQVTHLTFFSRKNELFSISSGTKNSCVREIPSLHVWMNSYVYFLNYVYNVAWYGFTWLSAFLIVYNFFAGYDFTNPVAILIIYTSVLPNEQNTAFLVNNGIV